MIAVQHLTIRQGNFELQNISFTIPDGVYGVLVGSSGCGKTTILECICGLRRPVRGAIILNERDVSRCRPAERGVGYVPQDLALFPTMHIAQQIAFPLILRRHSNQFIEQRVRQLAELMSISYLLDRMPGTLSGGEAQRVALARALAHDPSLLCMDEPLSALDENMHDDMCDLLKKVQTQTRVTILHVTHRRKEVQRLADVLFAIKDGRVEESRMPDGNPSDQGDP